ncbi:hypothetical protein TSH7_01370 [Azospirillum sp. TSH7]|uniref:hypothetical protein n=1 Tax=unclassified Azospirillum TaxID=2630922 RepID=UPI000D61CF8D|nr:MULTISPECIES: hypothetical protein [unclassified Azospirillum]PWC69122.1 hypothetical protein TSH7_01370 [Azospirillum sp. TSH7]PWC71386.1 hypothetical protein TSH20_03705 [Azospirillum sp. TSH20]
MADTLTPEQRARDVLSAIWNGSDAVPAIAHTIRAAETAAVEAERARCAKIADEWHEWYEKPGSGTRHAQRIAHHIRNPEADNAR